MDRMLYVAMSGAKQNMLAQAHNANNMANVSTTGFKADLAAARDRAVGQYRDLLGVYADFCARLRDATPRDVIWARDITISNSSWGKRAYFQ
mgnify:CR=1 FL=1